MSASISQLAEGTRERVERWRASLREAGISHQVTSTRRSLQEQRLLFDKFQRGESDLPVAEPGTSLHEQGRAIDVVFETEDDLLDAVDLAEDVGLRWAGENDPVHFEDRTNAVAGFVERKLGEISLGPVGFPLITARGALESGIEFLKSFIGC